MSEEVQVDPTHLERYKALFDETKVTYREEIIDPGTPGREGVSTMLVLEANVGTVEGYRGFVAEFSFDDQGALLNVAVWE